jgi:hypothetical protein
MHDAQPNNGSATIRFRFELVAPEGAGEGMDEEIAADQKR